MEEKRHCSSECCSRGDTCGSGFGCVNKIFFLRWFLGIIIILLVFCVGVQLGEIRAELGKSSSGYRHGMKFMMNPVYQYDLPESMMNY